MNKLTQTMPGNPICCKTPHSFHFQFVVCVCMWEHDGDGQMFKATNAFFNFSCFLLKWLQPTHLIHFFISGIITANNAVWKNLLQFGLNVPLELCMFKHLHTLETQRSSRSPCRLLGRSALVNVSFKVVTNKLWNSVCGHTCLLLISYCEWLLMSIVNI